MSERVKNALNFRKPSRIIIVAAVALVAVLRVGFALYRHITFAESPTVRAGTYILENMTERQKFERLASFTLHIDGTADFAFQYTLHKYDKAFLVLLSLLRQQSFRR